MGKPKRAAAPRKRCRKCARYLKSLTYSWQSYAEDTERLAGALRRIKTSLASFDKPVYESASAYAGQVLFMRQAVEAALNPSRAEPRAAPPPPPHEAAAHKEK